MREFNPFAKRWKKGDKRVALVYPNHYVGGIANIGLQHSNSNVQSRIHIGIRKRSQA